MNRGTTRYPRRLGFIGDPSDMGASLSAKITGSPGDFGADRLSTSSSRNPLTRVLGIDAGDQPSGVQGVSASWSTIAMIVIGAGIGVSVARGSGVGSLVMGSVKGALGGAAVATGLKYAGAEGF